MTMPKLVLRLPFSHLVIFKMLKSEGKINEVVIENMMIWHHSGFSVYCGNAIWPHNEQGLENLARYIIRASFSQERMRYEFTENSVIPINLIGVHLYSPLFATLHNPFYHTTFLGTLYCAPFFLDVQG